MEIQMCEKISSYSFKNEITYLQILYVYPFTCVQTNEWC